MEKILNKRKCKPCEGFSKPLKPSEYKKFLNQLKDWEVVKSVQIEKIFEFKHFKAAIRFVNRVGEIAEAEGHHPDILIYSYKFVKITLSTHALKGLSENDFVLAAKVDGVVDGVN